MLLGLLQSQGTWSVQSNKENGEGYSDISIRTPERTGIVIELKYGIAFWERDCRVVVK